MRNRYAEKVLYMPIPWMPQGVSCNTISQRALPNTTSGMLSMSICRMYKSLCYRY
jgi:hypothetical protein